MIGRVVNPLGQPLDGKMCIRDRINNKTTAVRVIPVPGKTVGEVVEFGGLLGYAPIIEVSPYSAAEFIARGGRIPAPIRSLTN